MIRRLCGAIAGLSGWRAGLLAFTAGLIAALGLPPVYAWPGLFVAFPILCLLTSSDRSVPAPRWRAYGLGWCFGFGFFLAGLYWMGFAFLVDSSRHAWLLPFAISAVPAGLALFVAAAVGLSAHTGRPGLQVWALAAAWMLAELARGYVLTGFPWNLLGYAWGHSLAVMQSASLFGVYGLSFLTVLAAASPFPFIRDRLSAAGGNTAPDGRFVWRPLALPVFCGILFVAVYGFGANRLQQPDPGFVPEIDLVLVQPNIPQHLKWRPENRQAHLEKLIGLSQADPSAGTGKRVVIWPETALPFAVDTEKATLNPIALRVAGEGVLLSGAMRVEAPQEGGEAGQRQFYNSLIALDGAHGLITYYDKVHLVPFGEYVPMRWLLQKLGIERLAAGRGDFSTGAYQALLHIPNLPRFQPLICYEAIFPHEVGSAGRPEWLLNITNDAWFGTSTGPYQHFVISQARAIELGVPLVRVANTGISGIVDAYGRVTHRLGLNESGKIVGRLPNSLSNGPFYQQFGDLPAALFGCFMGIFILLFVLARRKTRPPS